MMSQPERDLDELRRRLACSMDKPLGEVGAPPKMIEPLCEPVAAVDLATFSCMRRYTHNADVPMMALRPVPLVERVATTTPPAASTLPQDEPQPRKRTKLPPKRS